MRNTPRGTITRHGAIAGLMVGSVLLGGGMFLAGCSAGSSDSVASSSKAAGQANVGAPALATAPRAAAAAGGSRAQGGTGTTARLGPASSIVYTAQLTVRAGNVSSAAAQAAEIAEGVGGYVSNETAKVDPDHPSDATASV